VNTQEEAQRQKHLLQLMGKFDRDPGKYRPLYYGVHIDVGVATGSIATGSVTINMQPYIWTHVLHQIVGNTNDYATTGLAQDGQYLIELKDEQSNYQNVPLPADMLFGSVRIGDVRPLAYPIPFAGNKTITITLTNLYTRVFVPVSPTFRVYVALGGVAEWGDLYPQTR
jgi:hypothetical protein